MSILPEASPDVADNEPSASGSMARLAVDHSQGGIVLTDDEIARALRLLEQAARERIPPEDLPEVIAAEQRHRHFLFLLLIASAPGSEERTFLVNGIEFSDYKLTEYHKLASRYLRVARMSEFPKGQPSPDLGPRFDAARFCDVVDLIQTLTGQTAIKVGQYYKVHCPLPPAHDAGEPSLTIFGPGRGWHCFSCHRGGSSIDFVMLVNHCNATEAMEWIETHCDTWPEAWGGKARA